jgi:hypothetical protein
MSADKNRTYHGDAERSEEKQFLPLINTDDTD